MFGLIDVNSFTQASKRYSDLHNAPVAVLSNNGCIIARSKKTKKYVKLGDSWFKLKNQHFPVKYTFFKLLCALSFYEHAGHVLH